MQCSHGRRVGRLMHSDARQRTIAVLGGGISGIVSALVLSRKLPMHNIVLIEGDKRLGGYIGSHRVCVGKDTPLFENGPRSIRPVGYKGMKTLELVITVSKQSPSARNRFIYYAGQLNKLPTSIGSAIIACARLPLLRTLFPQILSEPWVPKKTTGEDESVHQFMSRRLGTAAAANLVSAMMHGIYAGDSRKLSIKSVLPSLVELENTHGALSRALLPRWLNPRHTLPKTGSVIPEETTLDHEIIKCARNTSIYSFPEGLREIVDAIETHLVASPNVSIWMDSPCEAISHSNEGFKIQTRDTAELQADRLVSAIPAANLAGLFPDLPHLAHNPRANVGVVDVVLLQPGGSVRLPINGFGYLVPRSTHNPDEILGVILDSSAVPNQGSSGFVKVTVMIGGPYWDHLTTFPSPDDLESRALRALETQLGLPKEQIDEQVQMVRARVLRDTIPQYLVGHVERIAELKSTVSKTYNGLTLVGASYAGVGVNDCIAGAMKVCESIARSESGNKHDGTTGLEDIA